MADPLLEADPDAGPDVLASRGGGRQAARAASRHLGIAGDGQLGGEEAAALAEQLLQGESELEPGKAGARASLEAEQAVGHVADRAAYVPVRSERVAEVRSEAQPRAAERAPAGSPAQIDDVGAGRGAEERDGGGGSERDFHEGAA